MAGTMRVVEIAEPGGPEVLRLAERPRPVPGAGEILVAVDYAGVNRPDALQRAGLYPAPSGASDLPGLECAGRVAAVGPGVTRWAEGDAVCALLPGGGYAEFAVAPADHALRVPDGMDMAHAAALPETHFTVWTNVFERGRLAAGERLLVHGGASGIGTTAIQMAVARGARVFATAAGPDRVAACERLGAVGIDHTAEDFAARMREEGGADVVLDMVGGDYVGRNLGAMAEDGRVVQIAFLRGARVEVDLTPLMTRRLTLTGSTLRPQSVAAKARIARALEAEIWPLLDAGRIGPVMDAAFPLAAAADAHRRMEAREVVGKVVLKVR